MAINDKFKPHKRIIGGLYQSTPPSVTDGDNVALLVDQYGRMVLSCTAFEPQGGTGQTVTIGGSTQRSTVAMVVGSPHWIWTDVSCWINIGDNTVVAASGDFPLPAGAVVEFTPTSSSNQYVAVIQFSSSGTLYIGQSAA